MQSREEAVFFISNCPINPAMKHASLYIPLLALENRAEFCEIPFFSMTRIGLRPMMMHPCIMG
jgi:hypothetical protein